MTPIERAYQDRAVRPGDPLLLGSETAIQFIDECLALGIEVFGFDRFAVLSDRSLEPLLEEMMDFGWEHLRTLSYLDKINAAKSMIRSKSGTGIGFEIVVADAP